ncbi:MAG: hypothetical protein Q7S92_02130 [Candidatus Diapherotrites archaeon]|nr:hypothetical protein [Candidatus Diapherotrites archaeon]
MNNKGQSALEYLMTYGWALIVIAIVVGVLIVISSSSTAGVVCQPQSTDLGVQTASVTRDRVQLSLQNRTGVRITSVAVADFGDFSPVTDLTASAATVDAGINFSIDSGANDGPGALGRFTNGVIRVTYTKTGLTGASDTNIVCSGTL